MPEKNNEIREGKIKYFGGFDSKKKREKDFGYLNDPKEGDAKFYKTEVLSLEDLEIISSNTQKGKGIYVNYKLKPNPKKKPPYFAYDVQIKKTVDFSRTYPFQLKEYYIQATKHGERLRPIRTLRPSVLPEREIIYNSLPDLEVRKFVKIASFFVNNNATAYVHNLIDKYISTIDEASELKNLINTLAVYRDNIFLKDCLGYLEQLTNESLLTIASQSSSEEIPKKVVDLIIHRLFNEQGEQVFGIRHLNSSFLQEIAHRRREWHKLSLEDLTYLYLQKNQIIDEHHLDDFRRVVINKIKNHHDPKNVKGLEEIDSLENYVECYGELFEILPNSIRKKVLRKRYRKFLQIVENWESYRPQDSNTVTVHNHEIYEFDDLDIALANKWIESAKKKSEFIKNVMFSARGAEKAAIYHYQQRNYEVEDIAIKQVEANANSNEWKKYDVRLKKHRTTQYIDVKNAISNYHNKKRYREFRIPNFKVESNKNILIVGVLSVYRKNMRVDGQKKQTPSITILGELNENLLRNLEKRCKALCPHLDISLRKVDEDRKLGKLGKLEYIPPWMFDFNDDFYSDRLQIEKKFRNLNQDDIPSLSELKFIGISPLSLALSSSLSFPYSWESELNNSQIRFAKILEYLVGGTKKRVALPHLFLAILTHFIENCSNPDPTFYPEIYKYILFINSPLVPGKMGTRAMGIYDPVFCLSSICKILEIVWKNCEKELLNYRYFKFDPRGILQGIDRETNDEKTILAYCGGWIKNENDKEVRCGNQPLYIGYHRNCPNCRKLICEQCGFCCKQCKSYQKLRSGDLSFDLEDYRQELAQKSREYSQDF